MGETVYFVRCTEGLSSDYGLLLPILAPWKYHCPNFSKLLSQAKHGQKLTFNG